VKQNDTVLHDVAGAMIDGIPVDWSSAESTADDESMRRVVRELKVIAAIADVHGTLSLSSDHRAIESEVHLDTAQRRSAADAESPSETLQTWGALRLLEKVGEGAFGSVYRAWDMRLDREVALKVLRRQESAHSREATAVIDEGRMLAQVRHPNVVTVHGADRSAGRVGLWMEFIQGQTLEHLLRERGPFGAGEATLIGLDVCRALSAVHRAGLLHRDIKARNVMREHGGRIVLMDFGAGVDHGDSDDSASGLAGTPLYMAPEVLNGKEASVGSDIYSVGVLLYHLVTGSYPVHGNSVQEIRARHSLGERTFLRDARPDLPDDFVQIVEQALSTQPERRYVSAGAMEAALASAKDVAQPVPAASAHESLVTSSVQTAVAPQPIARTAWPWRKLAIAAGLLLLASTGSLWLAGGKSEPPVIAVLPFKNLSVDPESDYFVDGLTDEVIRNLSVIDGLTVRSSTSSFTFKNKPRNTREVGMQLNANLVLEASVLRSGSQLRINARLVRAADDVPLWSERYDRELKDIFVIQDEISRSIVNELRLKLGRGQRRYAANVEAYDQYLKARVLQARRGPATRQAIDLFEQVVAKDPAFAPAYAARASAYGWYLVLQVPSVDGLPVPADQARAIVRRDALEAIRLDPLLAEVHDAMGWVHSLDLEWAEAEKAFRHALDLNPRLTTTYTDFVLSTLLPEGKLDEALRVLDDALHADPLSADVRRTMSLVQISARQYDAALDNCRRAVALDREVFGATGRCEQALIHKGYVAQAIAMMEKSVTENPALKEGGGRGYGHLGYAYAISGRRAEAEAQAVRNDGLPHQQATIYGGLGDKERAFAAIEQLAVLNPHRALSWLTRPELDLLRGDPRVTALQRKFGVLR
jgi:serine/threonine protein kinase